MNQNKKLYSINPKDLIVKPKYFTFKGFFEETTLNKIKKKDEIKKEVKESKYIQIEKLVKKINSTLHNKYHDLMNKNKKIDLEKKPTLRTKASTEYNEITNINEDNLELPQWYYSKVVNDPEAPYKKLLERIRTEKRNEEEKKILKELLSVKKKEVRVASCYDFSLQSKRKTLYKKHYDPQLLNDKAFMKSIKLTKKDLFTIKNRKMESLFDFTNRVVDNINKKAVYKKFKLSKDNEKYEQIINSDEKIKDTIISNFKIRK